VKVSKFNFRQGAPEAHSRSRQLRRKIQRWIK